MDAETLVGDYLRQLEAEARQLPAARRQDLVGEVREHIEIAIAASDHQDAAAVRTILDRLGSPDAIVSAEAAADGGSAARGWASATTATVSPGWGATEIAALLLLTIGAVMLPLVGPLLGLVFVWASKRWTRPIKLIITAIAVVLLLLPMLLLMASLFGMRA